jgi:flagellar capping protein FliD
VRAQLVEKLTRLLGESFVKRLFVDRTKLLESQGDATAQTQQLEERIETIQTRVQQKYREYEERIAQLEQELATAEEEKRDLIRAKIVLARQELEAERAKHRVDWN